MLVSWCASYAPNAASQCCLHGLQTGLADKAKQMGINLPTGGAGAAPANPNAEKAAVAAAAPGIVKVQRPLNSDTCSGSGINNADCA